jgi:hypothetical protein
LQGWDRQARIYSKYGIERVQKIGQYSTSATCVYFMRLRRLDDRIRGLSELAIVASPAELDEILPKLLTAIHEKMERLRALAAGRFLAGRTVRERRDTPR